VRISLNREGQRIRVAIEDWSDGFDPQKVAQNRLGIQGSCERARMFGGEATIDSALSKGTRVVVDLPLVEIGK
jgi:signal transduction histidine kinase